jgi:RNA polymerase sigma-70 factor (ECF subfamily)
VPHGLDAHLAAHLNASDIVQEALADAVRKLPDYSHKRPLPFYPWLHRLASERLVQARRRYRREPEADAWPDSSANLLVDRLVASDATPGHALIREEQRQRVREALDRLASPDREVLIMRYLDELTFPEIAAILGIEEGAAKMRHLRALQRIRTLIEKDGPESGP